VTKNPPHHERRKQPRVFVRALVDYESPGTFLYDYSKDLSEGGIFLETERPLPTGTPVTLRFTLPDIDRVFEVKGKVAWINETKPKGGAKAPKFQVGMGVQFEEMEEEDRKTIRDYVTKLLKRSG
jgi:type IV pilus assembly protein PilZ